jgi:drug/metabolite transporter (DMT)-like permease
MIQKLNTEAKGLIAIVASAFMFGFTGLFIRLLTGCGLNVYSINFIEYLIGIPLILLISKWSIVFACLIYFPFFLFHNTISSLQQVLTIFITSVFFLGIATPLYFFGLRYIDASTAGILLLIEIISGVIVGLIFYQEIPQFPNLFGGILIVISCVLVLIPIHKVRASLRRVGFLTGEGALMDKRKKPV